MTKTARIVVEMWESGNSVKMGNTRTDGDVVFLFGKAIIRREGGRVFVRTAGYPTRTTKDRLNCVSGVQVHTCRGVLYLNGEEWIDHEDWTEVKDGY